MSHFTVLIASKTTEEIENLLEPFDENTEVDPHWVDEDYDYLRDNPNIEGGPTKDSSIEEVFAFVQERYADDDEKLRLKDGVIQRQTTYNPDSKWDYWRIGGRWAGRLELTSAAYTAGVGHRADLSWEWSDAKEEDLPTGVDQALKGHVDIEGMRNRAVGEAEAKWVIYADLVEKHGEVIPFSEITDRTTGIKSDDKEIRDRAWQAAREEYNAQPIVAAAKEINFIQGLFSSLEGEFGDHTHDSYIEKARLGAVPGYAFLSEETGWLEPGRMGWFGMSSDTEESRLEYQRKVNEVIDSLPDDYYLTIVDCHI